MSIESRVTRTGGRRKPFPSGLLSSSLGTQILLSFIKKKKWMNCGAMKELQVLLRHMFWSVSGFCRASYLCHGVGGSVLANNGHAQFGAERLLYPSR